MKRASRVIVLALAAILLHCPRIQAFAQEYGSTACRLKHLNCARTMPGGYAAHAAFKGGQNRVGGSPSARSTTTSGAMRLWAYVPACPANGPPGGLDAALCIGATQSCAQANQILFREYTALVNGPWTPTGTVCLGPTDFQQANAPPPPLLVALEVWKRMPVPTPSLGVKPGAVGLANLDSYFWVSDPGGLTASAVAGPNVVVVHAVAVRYEWRFGDGSAPLVSGGPGRPWPARSEIAHAYRQLGRFPVTVTVHWHGRFQVNGGPAQDVPGPPVLREASLTYPVREIQTVLTS